ncbi:hypothetical protein H7X68_02035 [Candidatus Saccharibacteria bacterium]|nr:hypothetical protein [Candidatus Saccharibacteria bacterium]
MIVAIGSVLSVLMISIISIVFAPALFAANLTMRSGVDAARGDGQPSELFGDGGILTTITNTLLFIVGALSVIMIIIGGLRYVVSGGSSTSVTAAKNTILYAIVGLVVSFLAFAAINFVLGTLTGGGAGGTNV